MPKYLSGRVKIRPQVELTEDRYQYIGLDQVEPNLGSPPESQTIPPGQQYQVVSIANRPGERFWVPIGGGVIPGAITIRDEEIVIPSTDADPNLGISSITDINFVGSAVTVTGYIKDNGHPGTAVTVTVEAVGNDHEIQYNNRNPITGIGSFTGAHLFVYNNDTAGIASVGIGTTDPTNTLHVVGDIRLTGTIYDTDNDEGSQNNILVKNNSGGVEWTEQSAVTSGAGGDVGQVQFHGATGLVDGADNVYFDDVNNRLGIGSAIPRTLLDVVGVASFRRLEVAGITTTYGLLDINGGGQANTFKVEDLTQGRVTYAGAGGELQDSANLTFDGDGLTVGYATITKLKVTGVGTIGNIEIAGLNDNVITTTLGNLTLDSYGGTVVSNDPININDNSESNNFNTGSFITQGGGVFNKNVIVGGSLSHYGPAPTDPVSVAATISGAGGITTTGGHLYVGGDLFIRDNLTYLSAAFAQLYVSPGVSTFVGVASAFDDVYFNGTGDVGSKVVHWDKSADTLNFPNDSILSFGSDSSHRLTIAHGGSGKNLDIKNNSGWINFWAGGTNKGFSIGNGDFSRNLFKADNDSAVELYWAGDTGTGLKLSTSGMGVTVTGITSTNYIWSTGISTFAGKVLFHNLDDAGKDIEWQPTNDRLAFYDSVKATFGNEADLTITHTGTKAEIINTTGWMSVYAGGEGLTVGNADLSKLLISADNDADVKLYWAGATGAGEKLATTSDGVKITGGLQDKDDSLGTTGQLLQSTGTEIDWVDVDDLTTVNANKVGVGSTNPSLTSHFQTAGIGTYYMTFVEHHNPYDARQNEYVYSNSNIVFDSLQNRLGIGTTAPESRLHAVTYDGHNAIRVESSGAANRAGIEFYRQSSAGFGKGAAAIWTYSDLTTSNGKLLFGTANNAKLATQTPKMVIDADGRVGIGTTIPRTSILHARTLDTEVLRLESNNAGASGAELFLQHNPGVGNMADNDAVGLIQFQGKDDAYNDTIYSSIKGVASDVSNTNEKGALTFETRNGNNLTEKVRISTDGRLLVNITDVSSWNGPEWLGSSKLVVQGDDLSLFKNSGGDVENVVSPKLRFVTQSGSLGEIDVKSEGGASPHGRGGSMRFYTKFTGEEDGAEERLRITSDGHVGIGTTYPNNPYTMDDDIKLNTSILAVGIVTANHYYGTFKGDIDPTVPITNAKNILIVDDTTPSDTHYIHFGSASSGYDGVEVDSTGLVYQNDKLGVGNIIPNSFDGESNNLVVGSGSGDQGITIYSGSSVGDHGSIFFADGTSGAALSRGQIRYEQNTELMSFVVNGVERLYINKDNNINPASHEVQSLGESDAKRWNAVWAKEFRGGTFYGTIDCTVTVPNANCVKTTATTTDGKYFLTFVDSNNDPGAIESVYTGIGLTVNPNHGSLYLDGSLHLQGDSSEANGDIHSQGGSDGIFVIENEGSRHIDLNVRNSSNDVIGIASFTSEGGSNNAAKKTYFDSGVFPKESGAYNLGKPGNTDCADGHVQAAGCWNNVYACKYYGDGSNLTSVGSATAWQADAQENLRAGTEAGNALDANTCYNVFVGHEAGKLLNGDSCGHANNPGGNYNIMLGGCAGRDIRDLCDVIAIGRMAGHNYNSSQVVGGNTCFGRHIFLGANAGWGQGNASGACNIAIGVDAFRCISSGSFNVSLGRCSGRCLTSGDSNILLGNSAGCLVRAGNNNTFLGHYTGRKADGTDGCKSCNNTFIGYCAVGCNQYDTVTKCSVAIGFNVRLPIHNEVGRNEGDADKQLVIGNGSGNANHWLVGDKDRNVGIGTTIPNSASEVADNDRILAVTGIVTAIKYYGDGSCLTNIGSGDNAAANANNIKIDLTTDQNPAFKVPFIRADAQDLSYQALYAQDETVGAGITYSARSRNLYNSASIVAGAPGHNGGSIGIGTHDGYGNANLMFNHIDGRPDRNGSSARIEVNVDATTNPAMSFELKANTTKEVATSLTTVMKMLVNDDTNISNNTTSALVPGTNGGSDLGSDTNHDGRHMLYWDKAFVNEYYGVFKGTIDSDVASITLNQNIDDVLSVDGNELGGVDPNADRIVFWDDSAHGSAGKLRYLTVGDGLTLSGTTLTADAGGGSGGVTDVLIDYTSRGNSCNEPITVTTGTGNNAGKKTINIPNTSNADGKKWVQTTQPANGDVCDGDIWYDTSGAAAGTDGNTPIRGIIMWFGSESELNALSNWKLCDGTTYGSVTTPDLRNKFVLGARDYASGTWRSNITGTNTTSGGNKNAVLPKHDHSKGDYTLQTTGSHSHGVWITHTNGGDATRTGWPSLKGTGGDEHVGRYHGAVGVSGQTLKQLENNNNATNGNFIDSNGGHTHTMSGKSGIRGLDVDGNSDANQTGVNMNLPPYYVLAYIMRVS